MHSRNHKEDIARARLPEVNHRSKIMELPRLRLTELLSRAVQKRELRSDLDLPLAVALLLGPMMYLEVMRHAYAASPSDWAEFVADSFWRGNSSGKCAEYE